MLGRFCIGDLGHKFSAGVNQCASVYEAFIASVFLHINFKILLPLKMDTKIICCLQGTTPFAKADN